MTALADADESGNECPAAEILGRRVSGAFSVSLTHHGALLNRRAMLTSPSHRQRREEKSRE